MSGIFGWANAPMGRRPPGQRVGSTGDGEQGSAVAALPFERSDGHAVGSSGGVLRASIARDGERLAAVQGRVVWPDQHLARLAADAGAAAALLAAHERWRSETPTHLGGVFAIAVLDAGTDEALVAVDRLGIGTICFAQRGRMFFFGSTADQVASQPPVGATLDLQSVYDYMYAHVVPSPGTIYAGVEKLLPGERLRLRNGRLSRDFYWRMHYNQGRSENETALAEEFVALLETATREAIGDAGLREVGAFLSGGTDSSTVAGMMTRSTGVPADTYSIGFNAEGFDEMEFARVAVRHFGLHAHEYYVTPSDVVAAVPEIAAAYDEPFGNASAVPTLLCARQAAKQGKAVLLAGDGGDELFGGNARYAKQKIFDWYGRLPAPLRGGVIEPLARSLPVDGGPAVLRKARSYVEQAKMPLPRRLESYNLIERETPATVFTPEFLAAVDTERPARLAAQAYERADTPSPVDRMMHLDLKITLADNDLRKVRRMCELAGIEVRFPLLDERVVAFSGRLTPEQKVRGTQLRHFFKSALRDFLPPEILSKSKHGFGLPFGPWMRSDRELEELALGSLASLRRRGWLKPQFIDSLLQAHRTGHAAYYGTTIWVAMMLEQWLQARRLS